MSETWVHIGVGEGVRGLNTPCRLFEAEIAERRVTSGPCEECLAVVSFR
jgi:hypothetical protein